MSSPFNVYQFLCSDEETGRQSPVTFLETVTDEELFQSMDQIISEKYPDDHTYDVADSDEEPPLKKPRAIENTFDTSQQIRLVKRMYGCKETVKYFTSVEDRIIQDRIETIFRQMKQTVK